MNASTRKNSRVARLGGPVMLIKTGLTLTAFAAAAYSRRLGRKLEAAGMGDAVDGTIVSDEVAAKLRRQHMLNRVIPLLSGGLVVMGAVEGERLRSQKPKPKPPMVDLHTITPAFVEQRRLPDVRSKLAS